MIVALKLCPAHHHSFDTARVDMFVENYRISPFKKSGEHPHVCLVATRVKESVFVAEVGSVGIFPRLMIA